MPHDLADPIGQQTLEHLALAARFNRWMFETVAAHWQPGSVFEVGSGIGNLSQHVLDSGRKAVLSDLRSSYCDHLRARFGGHPHLLGVAALDLVDPAFAQRAQAHLGRYDNLYALNVIEHIADDRLALHHAAQLLRPGGRMVILVPAYPRLYNRFDHELGHHRRYTEAQLRAAFLAAGLRVQEAFAFNAMGIPGWWLSGSVLRKQVIPAWQLRVYDRLVPAFRQVDRLLGRRVGLSVVMVGEKPA